jgi:uncharacterized protein DUF4266
MYKILAMRRLLAIAFFALSSCAEVRPWQRGTLADPAMNPSDRGRLAAQHFVAHVLDTREGATGGTGTAGGGCGCN